MNWSLRKKMLLLLCIYLVPFLLQGEGRNHSKPPFQWYITCDGYIQWNEPVSLLALGTEMARSSKRFISMRQNTMDRHGKPMRNGNLRCNDASFSIFRRADMSWRTFARYLFLWNNFWEEVITMVAMEIQICFSFLVPDVDLQSGKTGNVVGKCPGILNHPH